jgi:hypothetical protein
MQRVLWHTRPSFVSHIARNQPSHDEGQCDNKAAQLFGMSLTSSRKRPRGDDERVKQAN